MANIIIKRSKSGFSDNPNARDIVKVGKEINRYKRLDGAKPKDIERRFGRDANKLFTKQPDKDLIRRISDDVHKGLGR